MSTPILLLDVDGVLQPTGSATPPGYTRHVTETSSVCINVVHGAWLRDLAAHCEIVWASTWGASANELIGRPLGLPTLAHVELGDLARDGTRKLEAVKAFVRDRPCAWLDDELYEDALAWAAQRTAPTLLRRTAGSVGMTLTDAHAVRDFVRSVDEGVAR